MCTPHPSGCPAASQRRLFPYAAPTTAAAAPPLRARPHQPVQLQRVRGTQCVRAIRLRRAATLSASCTLLQRIMHLFFSFLSSLLLSLFSSFSFGSFGDGATVSCFGSARELHEDFGFESLPRSFLRVRRSILCVWFAALSSSGFFTENGVQLTVEVRV